MGEITPRVNVGATIHNILCACIYRMLCGVDTKLNNITMEKLIELTKKHKAVMDRKGIIVSVYNNASGFLWAMAKLPGGTDLGWSEYRGDCEFSGAFKTYEAALEDALNLIDKGDLTRFQFECPRDKFHWGNYVKWVTDNYTQRPV